VVERRMGNNVYYYAQTPNMAENRAMCDGGINAMVEGSKFKESHILKILS
jgi:hypothetical protein